MKEIEDRDVAAHEIRVEKDDIQNARTGEKIEGFIGLYRKDTNGIVGVHSDKYGFISYQDIHDCIATEIAIMAGPTIEPEYTSYALPFKRTGEMGGRISMKWSVPSLSMECIKTGDVLNYTYECSPSHDGSAGVPSRTGADRVACMNGMVLNETLMTTTFKHSKHVDYKQIIKNVKGSVVEFEKGVKKYGQMFDEELNTRISWAEGHNAIKNIFHEKADREAIQMLWQRPSYWNNIPADRKPSSNEGWHDLSQFRDQHNVEVRHGGETELWKMPASTDRTQTVFIGDLLNCITDHLTHGQDSRLYAAQRSQKAFKQLLDFTSNERSSNASMKLVSSPPKRPRNATPQRREQGSLEILAHNPID